MEGEEGEAGLKPVSVNKSFLGTHRIVSLGASSISDDQMFWETEQEGGGVEDGSEVPGLSNQHHMVSSKKE